MASQGPFSATTKTNDGDGVSFSIVDGVASATLAPDAGTCLLKCGGFSFSIPSGKTITGLTVEAKIGSDPLGIASMDNLLYVNGVAQWDSSRGVGVLPSPNPLWVTIADQNEDWAALVSPVVLNGSGFFVGIPCVGASNNVNAKVTIEDVRVTAYYE